MDKWRAACERLIISRLPEIERQVETERPGGLRADSWPDAMEQHLDLLVDEYDRISKQSHDIAFGAFDAVNGMSHRQWYEAARRVLGVDLFQFEPWVKGEATAFVHVNTDLITKIQSDVQSEISRIVLGGFREGKRWETLQAEIMSETDLGPGVFKKTETRAELVARDQSLKLYANLGEKRQTNAGLTLYTWRCMNDERVAGEPGGKYANSRPSHACMEGKVCAWSKPDVYADSVKDALAGRWKSRATMRGGPGQPGSPGHGDGPICWCGIPGCVQPSHKRRLNPLFATWLMGWPLWWMATEPQPYARSEMAVWLSRQRSRLSCWLGE